MKQLADKRHGANPLKSPLWGQLRQLGAAAHDCAAKDDLIYIHAYDDLTVMAGQGTLADEIVMSDKAPSMWPIFKSAAEAWLPQQQHA